ncbi:putative transposase [Nonomuraea muscovyensis]|uniref:Putative transposase n=1 Tax=Nonomuraea muscovyensis TaxID=1124761 RepID=A0A7X0BWG4_9ACTN|nr:RNA-guided endonuclease TnpB family protein [Nonomuraea muscovyensis]MBB6344080.1 putative transposase [Nonomuraea muscovyensis]
MQLRYSFRLDPSPGQRIALAKAFGCARVVFNDALALRRHAHAEGLPFISDGELSKRVITHAKQHPERAWLGEVSAVVLQQALADACMAYRNFFAGISGRRKGPKAAPPRFRSRKDLRQAIRFTRNARFKVGEKLSLPKIGDVAVRWSRALPSEPSSVTVIKDAAGRYFASFVVEIAEQELPEAEAETGIDLGLGHFAVLADGRKIGSPRFLRHAEKKLRKLQKRLSRKEKGSKNRAKARLQVARQHAKVADARREFHHQASTQIIRDNQAVFVEDLAVNGLARTKLAKSVHDAGWSSFVAMLEYKAKLYGRDFARIGRFFPSSKLCSECGAIAEAMPLGVREWACVCGTVHDRDVNAAINILADGRAERLNASGGQVGPPRAVARPGERGSLPGAA